MRTLFFAIMILLLAAFCFAQDQSTLVYGKADHFVFTWSNLSGTAVDSIMTQSTLAGEFQYDGYVQSVTGSVAKILYTNTITKLQTTKYIFFSAKDITFISGLRICYNGTLTTGQRFNFKRTQYFPAKVDSVGGIYEGLWEGAKADSIVTVRAVGDTITLDATYPRGLTVVANIDMKFRTNRMTGWVSLFAGSSLYVPIRHTTGDKFYVAHSTIANVTIIRGKN